MKTPEYYMHLAYELAEKAGEAGEIPIGAIIISAEAEIIASAYNRNRSCHDATMHAEMEAIHEASNRLKNERLTGCRLYVTKEPCIMCLGAIIHSRISKVYIGARDEKFGACGTAFDIPDRYNFNHKPEFIFGILQKECSEQLSSFFRGLRKKKRPNYALDDPNTF